MDKTNSRISFSINKKKWSLNSSYNYTDGTYWSHRVNKGVFLESDSLIEFDNFSKSLKRTSSHNGDISLEYKPQKNTSISLEGSIRNAYTHLTDSLEFYWSYKSPNTRNVKMDGVRLSANGQFNLLHETRKGNRIKILSRTNAISNPKNARFIEPYILQKENKNFEAQSFVNQLDFEFPLIKASNDSLKNKFLTIETGIKSAHRKFTEDYKLYAFNPGTVLFENLSEFSNDLNYEEDIYAGYGLMKLGNKTYKISTGIRAEYSDISSATGIGNYNKS